MKKQVIRKRFIIILLAFILLITPLAYGCEYMIDFLPIEIPEVPQAPEPPPVPVEEEEEEEEPPPPPPSPPGIGRFTLRYDPNSTMNPIHMLNRDNIVLSSLIYESLFVLNQDLRVEPVLCARWESEDYLEYIFYILPDIAMHDGSTLTSEDVVYSFRQALLRGRFASRLYAVASIAEIDELSFRVLLSEANSRLINLLDFPIIKAGSIDEPTPPGTGPFMPAGSTVFTHLAPFFSHRNATEMPVNRVYLKACTDSELTELFDSLYLSLLWDDPASTFDIRLNRLHETRIYETTALQFIGFNANHLILRDPDVRRAISASIERQIIADEIMPGHSLASPLAISPAFEFYNPQWEHSHLTPFQEMSYLFERAGLEDFNNTSYLEIYTGLGETRRFTIDFIVNTENTHKVQAARRIERTLRHAGVDITVRELPWEQFTDALDNGNFDMYYGEIMLGGDFDLSPLLLPGPLNFGRTASTHFQMYIDSFLSARGQLEIEFASALLLEEIKVNAPFAPVLYKRHAIYSPLGAISGAEPNQSSIFHNFTEWTIDLDMLIPAATG